MPELSYYAKLYKLDNKTFKVNNYGYCINHHPDGISINSWFSYRVIDFYHWRYLKDTQWLQLPTIHSAHLINDHTFQNKIYWIRLFTEIIEKT